MCFYICFANWYVKVIVVQTETKSNQQRQQQNKAGDVNQQHSWHRRPHSADAVLRVSAFADASWTRCGVGLGGIAAAELWLSGRRARHCQGA